MSMEDYIVLADIPKIHLESDEELPDIRWRNQSPSPCRDQKLRTYRLVVPYRVTWLTIMKVPWSCIYPT